MYAELGKHLYERGRGGGGRWRRGVIPEIKLNLIKSFELSVLIITEAQDWRTSVSVNAGTVFS